MNESVGHDVRNTCMGLIVLEHCSMRLKQRRAVSLNNTTDEMEMRRPQLLLDSHRV
jgi:hypothetical protein